MPEHSLYIIAAYAVSLLLGTGLTAFILYRYNASRRALRQSENTHAEK